MLTVDLRKRTRADRAIARSGYVRVTPCGEVVNVPMGVGGRPVMHHALIAFADALRDEPVPGIVASRSRTTEACAARRRVWRKLRDRGLALEEIGALTGHDHTTVMNGLSRPEPVMEPEAYRAMREVVRRYEREYPGLWAPVTRNVSRTKFKQEAREREVLELWRLCHCYSTIKRLVGARNHSTILTALRRAGIPRVRDRQLSTDVCGVDKVYPNG